MASGKILNETSEDLILVLALLFNTSMNLEKSLNLTKPLLLYIYEMGYY